MIDVLQPPVRPSTPEVAIAPATESGTDSSAPTEEALTLANNAKKLGNPTTALEFFAGESVGESETINTDTKDVLLEDNPDVIPDVPPPSEKIETAEEYIISTGRNPLPDKPVPVDHGSSATVESHSSVVPNVENPHTPQIEVSSSQDATTHEPSSESTSGSSSENSSQVTPLPDLPQRNQESQTPTQQTPNPESPQQSANPDSHRESPSDQLLSLPVRNEEYVDDVLGSINNEKRKTMADKLTSEQLRLLAENNSAFKSRYQQISENTGLTSEQRDTAFALLETDIRNKYLLEIRDLANLDGIELHVAFRNKMGFLGTGLRNYKHILRANLLHAPAEQLPTYFNKKYPNKETDRILKQHGLEALAEYRMLKDLKQADKKQAKTLLNEIKANNKQSFSALDKGHQKIIKNLVREVTHKTWGKRRNLLVFLFQALGALGLSMLKEGLESPVSGLSGGAR